MNFINIKAKNQYTIILCAAILLAFFVGFPGFVLAGYGIDDAMTGLNTTAAEGYVGRGQTSVTSESGAITDFPSAVGRVVGAGLAFVGVIFFILMIYGGFIWMFARGNDQEVAKAKDLITSAVIGLVIVLSAYAITAYIGSVLTTGGA